MPFGLDPVYLVALPAFLVHARFKQQQVAAARAASMRRHPSAR